jgi:hypothetical protein
MPSSVNLLFLTTCSWPFRAFIMPVVSVTERFRLLGQGHCGPVGMCDPLYI